MKGNGILSTFIRRCGVGYFFITFHICRIYNTTEVVQKVFATIIPELYLQKKFTESYIVI